MQRHCENAGIAGEDCGRAIALVHVRIDHQSLAHGGVGLQSPYGYGDVVYHAKPFAVPGKRVVKSAADVDSETIF